MRLQEIKNKMNELIHSAYVMGYEDGTNDGKVSVQNDETEAYESGLNDAWECARKMMLSDEDGGIALSDILKIFGMTQYSAIKRFSASEAIAKIKEYEEKQKRNCDTCKYGGHTLQDLKKCAYCDGRNGWTPKQEERGCKTCTYSEHGEDGFFKCHAKGDCLNHEKWTPKKMTLDEAIKHCEEVADSKCDECGAEHRQLAEWLRELKQMKGEEE